MAMIADKIKTKPIISLIRDEVLDNDFILSPLLIAYFWLIMMAFEVRSALAFSKITPLLVTP